jgi:hypothetical protein
MTKPGFEEKRMEQLTSEGLLKSNHLLIEDGKTCEAHTHLVVKQMIEFAKLHCEAQLKAIIENVQMTGISYGNDKSITDYEVDKDSIINAYPLDLIK